MTGDWRRLLPGQKHGRARGTAVYGSGRHDADSLAELLGRRDRLDAWSRARGIQLTARPGDLVLLDQAIGRLMAEPDGTIAAGRLSGEIGIFLGAVIVAHVPGAQWRLWPNGHPVVRLAGRRDLDVVALAGDRIRNGTPPLAQIYSGAAGAPPYPDST